jgi:hypothetical protein
MLMIKKPLFKFAANFYIIPECFGGKRTSPGTDNERLGTEFVFLKENVERGDKFTFRQIAGGTHYDNRGFGDLHERYILHGLKMMKVGRLKMNVWRYPCTNGTDLQHTIDRKNNRDMGVFFGVVQSSPISRIVINLFSRD